MTVTTIKVDSSVRDRLKTQAESHGRTLGQHLLALADREDRDRRFASLRADIAATDPSLLIEYSAETEDWDSALADGLPTDRYST